MDSIWRIVLLCKKCINRVNSSDLCPYCFSSVVNELDCFKCSECNHSIHKECVKPCGSGLGLSVSVSVCIDCWIPDAFVNSVRVRRKKARERNNECCEEVDMDSDNLFEVRVPVGEVNECNSVEEFKERNSIREFNERNSVGEFNERNSVGEFNERNSVGEFNERNSVGRLYERDSVRGLYERDSVRGLYELNSVRGLYERKSAGEFNERNSIGEFNERNLVQEFNERTSVGELYERNLAGELYELNSVNKEVERKVAAAVKAKDNALRKAVAAKNAVELAKGVLNAVAGRKDGDGDVAELAVLLRRAINSSPKISRYACLGSSFRRDDAAIACYSRRRAGKNSTLDGRLICYSRRQGKGCFGNSVSLNAALKCYYRSSCSKAGLHGRECECFIRKTSEKTDEHLSMKACNRDSDSDKISRNNGQEYDVGRIGMKPRRSLLKYYRVGKGTIRPLFFV